jgi:hypothetical protein
MPERSTPAIGFFNYEDRILWNSPFGLAEP